MTEYQTLTVEVSDGLAVLTLNRPQVRNAINAQVQADVAAALDALREDDTVGALIFTGAGDRAFAAGADIGQLANYDLHTGLTSSMQRLYDAIESYEKPTIAAVNGYALGGGCELAMACDIRIAAASARFGLPETTLSVLPGAGGTAAVAHRFQAASTSCALRRPLATMASVRCRSCAVARSSAAGSASVSVTRCPARAQTIAICEPIAPAPITTT